METAKTRAPAAHRITRSIPAPREDVFRAWTHPQALVKWSPVLTLETSCLPRGGCLRLP
jgi:uncharacterized protein YndB with AHSA1/START domain